MIHPKYLFILFVIAGGCVCFPKAYEYETGRFPDAPVNLNLVNSSYDDYNMTLPVLYNEVALIFSSNRNSRGEVFDIIGGNYYFEWNKEYGRLRVAEAPNEIINNYLKILSKIKTPGNELGPLAYQIGTYESTTSLPLDFLLFASDTPDSTFNIYLSYIHYESGHETDSVRIIPLEGINSEHDDLYPTFYHATRDFRTDINEYSAQEIYFCSNADGQFDIYKVSIPENTNTIHFLSSEEEKQAEKLSINSSGNDKCPFIIGDVLLFASDREGGLGGYDLYYCLRVGDGWTEPVNFGPNINSEYNEYRPLSSHFWGYENDLILFSSDRPGGRGGFDLYYVGTDQFISSE